MTRPAPFLHAHAPTRAGRTTTVLSALAAIMLGVFLLYGAGFAQPAALHDAAHDGRHAFSLPCH